ncbi:SH3 domain-containing protein [Paeniglutamicibacter sp.]|uniref:SH3 domain-containing protein n=1 Tax=Paeniglutamicibacter sp. TaxID=1934391 RepID=UPI0039890A42
MQKKRIATAVALAVAVAGSSTGFVLPAASHALAPATEATASAPMLLEPARAAIAMKKVNLKKATTHNLNLRAGKSTKTKALLTIPKNTAVTVTETSGTWSKTKHKNKTGWVASRYLKNAPAAKKQAAKKPAPKTQVKSSTRKTTTYNLNLRAGKSAKNKVLVVIPKNTTVTVSHTSGTWSQTKYKNKTGWVASRYLKNAPAAKKSAPKAAAPKATYRWTTGKVNIRKGAGTSHASLGLVPANERVTYLKTAKGWSNVKSSKGTGWISNKLLDKTGQYSFAVYGTLRKGQSAYYILRGKTSKETKTTISSHSMYLQPNKTWLSYVIPSGKSSDKVVVERMDIKPASYRATVANMDKWERFNPNKPLADQNYNRVLVTDKDGKKSWAYLGSKKIGDYLTKNGIRVTSGDYLKRF